MYMEHQLTMVKRSIKMKNLHKVNKYQNHYNISNHLQTGWLRRTSKKV